ncbi:hypothetical protein BDY19DRAFT_994982 [Irpex rosettiformis]|uniref:Uncharacterized protein n=1 Tax=Irpex rosettiformis TaxID=378272 RepID=A0ACB8TZA9_9APHY|nr:hypothetical protein BDY19DRAFT_994982 [Irpex rosettiformis]
MENCYTFNFLKSLNTWYSRIETLYAQAGAAKDEEHISLQLSLELAREYRETRKKPIGQAAMPIEDETNSLWYKFPMSISLIECRDGQIVEVTHAIKRSGDDTDVQIGAKKIQEWMTNIVALAKQDFVIGMPTRQFEKGHGLDFMWHVRLQSVLPKTGIDPKVLREDEEIDFMYDGEQLFSLYQTETYFTSRDDHKKMRRFSGAYIIYGNNKIYLVPAREIITLLYELHEKYGKNTGPNVLSALANTGAQCRFLTKVFIQPKYEIKSMLSSDFFAVHESLEDHDQTAFDQIRAARKGKGEKQPDFEKRCTTTIKVLMTEKHVVHPFTKDKLWEQYNFGRE